MFTEAFFFNFRAEKELLILLDALKIRFDEIVGEYLFPFGDFMKFSSSENSSQELFV